MPTRVGSGSYYSGSSSRLYFVQWALVSKVIAMPITMKDIANELGISRTTVSDVLNNVASSRIATDTRRRVLQAARDLGYTHNQNAKALKTGKSQLIAILGRGARFEVALVLSETVEALLSERGYRSLVRERMEELSKNIPR